MSDDRPTSSIVSILNNYDHPSFAVRSNQNPPQTSGSLQINSQQLTHQPSPPIYEPSVVRQGTASQSPTASPRGRQYHAEFTSDAGPVASPGSSNGSSYGHLSSQGSSNAYHPYARGDAQQGTFRHPSRGPAAPRTPPEILNDPSTETQSPRSQSESSRGTGRKNKYPCPYARSHGCTSTFTTSGHAARHGKKHTGEKSVHCPICNKAFTRKDNMKQHIRTHRARSRDKHSAFGDAESDSRWANPRSDTTEGAQASSRTPSQSTVTSTMVPSPVPGPQPPS